MKSIVFVGSVFYLSLAFAQPASRSTEGRQAANEQMSLEGDVATYVGQVEAGQIVRQLAPFSGKTIRQVVQPGSKVKRGQPVIVLAQKTMGEAYADFSAKANVSGIVNEFHVAPGDEFSANEPIFTILDTTSHRINLAVSNKDHVQISMNDEVQIVAEGSQVVTKGTVYRKSLVPIAGSGLFAVEIRVPKEIPIGTFCQIKFSAFKDADAQALETKAGEARR